jgi:hypothetical protein
MKMVWDGLRAIYDAHEHGMDRRRNLDEFSRAFKSLHSRRKGDP